MVEKELSSQLELDNEEIERDFVSMREITSIYTGKKFLGCKWVFTIKYKKNCAMKRYKVRLMEKSYTYLLDRLPINIYSSNQDEHNANFVVFSYPL